MRRASVILPAVVAAVVLGAGCGGTDFKASTARASDGRAVLVAAATQTQAARSAHLSLRASFGSDHTITGDGGIDFEHHNATFAVDFEPIGRFEERVVNGVMYVRIGDGKWLETDTRRPASGNGGPLEELDPTQMLEYLRRVSNDVKQVGTETVRGTETTHYRATIELPEGASLPVDVWIDGQGYARKATLSTRIAGASLDVELEMYDFGVPVHVEAPPPDQIVAPGSGLGGILGGMLGG